MTTLTIKARSGNGTSRSAMLAAAVCLALLAPTAALAQTPTSGGTMTIINGSDIRSWDPAITSGTFPGGPMDVLDAVYGFIVYVNDKGVVTGGMAESLTSEDAITWTLKLREGVKFSDGVAYDAEAVKYNWERVADPATAAPSQAFVAGWASGMEVVDPLTLKITLPAANANFAAQIAELAPFIASPEALKVAKEKSEIKPVGAGAFLLDAWDQDVSVSMKRNPDYWDQPRPYLDTLKFAIIPETNARIATVVQGGATMMAGYPYQFGSNADADGVATKQIPIRGINRAYFNHTKGVFSDVRAREAFYSAIDRGRLMQAFTQMEGFTPPVSYFGTSSQYYDPAYSLPSYDPAKAQELISALAADGKPFEVKIVTYTNSDLKRLAAYVQQVISSYEGASATIEEVDQANLIVRCKQQLEFDLCVEGGVLVSNGAEPNISNLLRSTGNFNWGQYNNPEMDAALSAAASTVDPTAVKAAFSDVQKLVVEDLPLYIFGEQTRYLLLRDNTGGVVNSNGGILQKQFLYVCDAPCVE
ncbi:peptide/nickel transport system substrate-binding protein [Devosia enhydra]|uniref:Peptide/nickel transport system substrate-binding protein n=1 Tax=Devosia enhydra TaxID=665118 RepID=A0A1K2HS88_9HYPH|nr:peptide/nickel transport system substrate-binding protein [Devosia enhydra]